MKREFFYTNYYDLFDEFTHCASVNDWAVETKEDFRRELEFFKDMLNETEGLLKNSRTKEYDYDPENDDRYVFFSSSLDSVDGAYAKHHYDPEPFENIDDALRLYKKRYNVTLN